MWDLIAKFQAEGKTIVLTTHYMEEAERLCDRVAIVDHGKVIALGTPSELMESIDMSHLPPRSHGKPRLPSRMSSCPLRAGRYAMSERVSFPITDARTERKPLKRRSFKDGSMVQLTLVRFREFIREPEAVFWTFIFPILLAAGLGIAFRQRGPEQARSASSAALPATAVVDAIKRDSTLIVRTIDDSAAALALRTGKIALLVVPGSAQDSIRLRLRSDRSEAVNARVLVDRAIQVSAGRVDPVRVNDTYVTEAGSRYIDFLIPGLLGMNLMGSSVWGIGFSIVTARSKKLLKRFMATPMSRIQYLLSFLASRLVFLILEVVTLIGFGYWAFGVPLRGSLITLFLISLLGAVSFGGLGLLARIAARTTEAVSGIMNFIMLPMWIFSGVFFSSSNFPDMVQPF